MKNAESNSDFSMQMAGNFNGKRSVQKKRPVISPMYGIPPYVLIIASTKKLRMKYAHSIILTDQLHIEDDYRLWIEVKYE